MSRHQRHPTAAVDAIAPAAVAPADRTGRPVAEATGDIAAIISNEHGLYEGDLACYFRALFFDATNIDRPYHNLRHMLHVTWLCYQAAEYYRHRLTPRQIRHLLIAALFHDFDHPGHPHPAADDPDSVNIALAIAGLRRHLATEDQAFLPAIEGLIEATHYPYTVGGNALDLSGQIIRDADLAQVLSPAWIQQVIVGLAREQRVEPLQMLRQQPGFLANLSFNTEWAHERFPPRLIDAKIAETRQLMALLTGGGRPDRASQSAADRPRSASRSPRANPCNASPRGKLRRQARTSSRVGSGDAKRR